MTVMHRLTCVGLSIAAVAACSRMEKHSQTAGPAAPAVLEGSWQVEDIDHRGMIDNAMVRIDFGAAGRISGRGGCNSFTGALTYADGVATVGPLAVTKKMCAPALMDLEAKFFNRLQGALRASMTEDGALVLSDEEGRLLMRLMDDQSAAAAPAVRASGEVTWEPAAPLPENVFLRVKLLDVSKMDVAAETLAEAKLPIGEGPPVAFSLAADGPVDPRARLSVSAQVSDGAALYFISDTNNPVSPETGAAEMSIRLKAVDAMAGTGAGGQTVTPSPIAYRCGGEIFQVAFEAGAAYVTLADGTVHTLDRLNAADDPEAPRTFTDGRLTFVQETEGMAGLRVLFARGRMVPAPCERVEG